MLAVVSIFLFLFVSTFAQQRNTVNGEQCQPFPQVYKSVQYYDCFQVNGTQSCYTINHQLEECNPENKVFRVTPVPSPTPAPTHVSRPRITIDGQDCILPFTFSNVTYYDCIPFVDAEFCLLNDQWTQCAQSKNSRITYESYYENINNNPNSASYIDIYFEKAQNDTQSVFISSPSPTPTPIHIPAQQQNTPRYTISGLKCDEKYVFNGVEYSGCILINGQEYCAVLDSLKQCEAIPNSNLSPQMDQNIFVERFQSPSSGPRMTKSGIRCEFPIQFRGVAFMDCIILGGKEQCMVNKTWELCAPITEDSPDVMVPHQNNNTGVIYQDCVIINGSEMCYVQNTWKYCLGSELKDVNFYLGQESGSDDQEDFNNMTVTQILLMVFFISSFLTVLIVYVFYLRKLQLNKQKYQDFDAQNEKENSTLELSKIEMSQV